MTRGLLLDTVNQPLHQRLVALSFLARDEVELRAAAMFILSLPEGNAERAFLRATVAQLGDEAAPVRLVAGLS